MEIMLDKKQIQAIFLFEFKMGHKVVETTHNNNVFGQELLLCFKKFCKADRSLEYEGCGDLPSKVDNDQLNHQS